MSWRLTGHRTFVIDGCTWKKLRSHLKTQIVKVSVYYVTIYLKQLISKPRCRKILTIVAGSLIVKTILFGYQLAQDNVSLL